MASLPKALATAQQITQQVGAMTPLAQISSVVQTLSNIQGFNVGAFSQLTGTIQSALQGFDQASSIVQGFASGSPVDAFVNTLNVTGLAGSSIGQIAQTGANAYRQADSFLSSVGQAQSWAKLNNQRPSVEQTRAQNSGVKDALFFPRDIGKYWISLEFESANFTSIMGSRNQLFERKRQGGVILPVPMNLVDGNRLDYNPISLTGPLTGAAKSISETIINNAGRFGNILSGMVGGGIDAASALTGLAVNTHQTLKFNQPILKEHQFTWKLVPSTPQESKDLQTIIRFIKSRIYPRSNDLAFKYPDLVNVVLFNGNEMFFFKPAYVQSFSVNFTADGPAFHKDKYPTSLELSMSITENAVWTAEDFGRPELGSQEAFDLAKLPVQSVLGLAGGSI